MTAYSGCGSKVWMMCNPSPTSNASALFFSPSKKLPCISVSYTHLVYFFISNPLKILQCLPDGFFLLRRALELLGVLSLRLVGPVDDTAETVCALSKLDVYQKLTVDLKICLLYTSRCV